MDIRGEGSFDHSKNAKGRNWVCSFSAWITLSRQSWLML